MRKLIKIESEDKVFAQELTDFFNNHLNITEKLSEWFEELMENRELYLMFNIKPWEGVDEVITLLSSLDLQKYKNSLLDDWEMVYIKISDKIDKVETKDIESVLTPKLRDIAKRHIVHTNMNKYLTQFELYFIDESIEDKIKHLQERLKKALDEESFDECVKLRDELKELEKLN